MRRTATSIADPALRRRIGTLRRFYEDRLAALVEIPSVSVAPEHARDVLRCADAAAGLLREAGAQAVLAPTARGGFPIVVGTFPGDPAWPTVTIYNHMDVQPADASEWRTPPFRFTRKGNRYFARGSTDDKGPALAALLGARLAVQDGARLNIQFLWETEEEIGSPNFDRGLRALVRGGKGRAGFATDSVAVSDTIWIAADRPAIAVGLRGLCGLSLRLQTSEKDSHSGTTGGAARNPVGELAALIAAAYDARTGRVKVPGFYRGVRAPSAREKRDLGRAGFSKRRFTAAHELRGVRFPRDADLLSAIMLRPTFEVHGIAGGYQGPGIKTIVPKFAEAKLSARLVPDQRPAEMFELLARFFRARCPEVEVRPQGSMEPYLGVVDSRENAAAARAMAAAFGRRPAFVREGASIGAVLTMQEQLAAPVVLMGLSLPEHGYHSINENFDWRQASGGIEMFYRYFFELAQT